MVTVHLGQTEFPAITAAAAAALRGNGISYMTYYMRLRSGWDVKRASTTPVRAYNPRPKKKAKAAKRKLAS